jgi:hypothetical protein
MKRFSWWAAGGLVLLCASLAHAQPNTIANLELWLDANDLSTFTFSGPLVTQWADKSGNAFHATPTAAGHEPTRVLGSIGGMPSVRFSTAVQPDGMLINSPAGQFNRGTTGYTIFVVDRYNAGTHQRTLQGRDGNNWLMGKWGNSDAYYADGFVYLPGNGGTTTISEAIGGNNTVNGNPAGHSTYHVNGLNVTQTAAPTGQPGRLGIMTGGQFPAESSDADISEIIAYDRVLNWNERRNVGMYLEQKYSLGNFYTARALDNVTVGSFTNSTTGADFSGNFMYAVDFGGTVASLPVGNANFIGTETGPIPGVTFTAPNIVNPWGAPNFGVSASDNNLETVMNSIRWNGGQHVTVDLAGLTVGEDYQLQLLIQEGCCANRGFQVEVENSILAPGFNASASHGNLTTAGGIVTYQFVARDTTANVRLLSLGGFTDSNPILNGLTMEFFPDAAATSSDTSLEFSADTGDTDTQTLTITNSGEAGSQLVINSATFSGVDAADFAVVGFTPNTVLLQGQSLDLLVQFTGQEAGDFSNAQLNVGTNLNTLFGAQSGGSSLSFGLSGVSTPEPATIAMWSIFGAGAVGYVALRRRRRTARRA